MTRAIVLLTAIILALLITAGVEAITAGLEAVQQTKHATYHRGGE